MTSRRRRLARLASATIALGTLVAALGAGSAQAAPDYDRWWWEDQDITWAAPDDAGGRSMSVSWKYGGTRYSAAFQSFGEHLILQDHEADGHAVVAYLKVEGNGTARFQGEGDYNLSFDEGLDYWIKVCVNDVMCSGWSERGTT